MNQEKKDIIVFDIETQNTFMDVGRSNYDKLLISVVVVYFYKDDTYRVYTEENIYELLPLLKEADLVVGFNLKDFDYPVLESYFRESLKNLRTLDILEEVHSSLGRRIKLDYLAEATLGARKTADGLMAVTFWRNKEMDKLIEYCKQDVKLTKELYEYGTEHGYLLYKNLGSLERIPVYWERKDELKEKLQFAFKNKQRIEISYSSPSKKKKYLALDKRMVDIYHMDDKQVIGFCHLRDALRTFNIIRILDIRLTDKKYQIPEGFDIKIYRQNLFI